MGGGRGVHGEGGGEGSAWGRGGGGGAGCGGAWKGECMGVGGGALKCEKNFLFVLKTQKSSSLMWLRRLKGPAV